MRRLFSVLLLACRPSVDDASGPCKPEVVASKGAHQIYVDDERLVFYVFMQALRTCPKDDCTAPTTLMTLPEEAASFLVDGGNVYVSRAPTSYGPARIERCAIAGCDSGATPIVPEEVTTRFAIDRGFIYYGASTSAGGEIRRCSVDGCGSGPTTVVSSSLRIGSFVMDATTLYWATVAGAYSCPISGCSSPKQLVGSSYDGVTAVDADHVYFVSTVYKSTNVFRCAIGGCGDAEYVVRGYSSLVFGMDGANLYYADFPPPSPTPLRRMSKKLGAPVDVTGPTPVRSNFQFDSQCIYWSDGSSIRRAPK